MSNQPSSDVQPLIAARCNAFLVLQETPEALIKNALLSSSAYERSKRAILLFHQPGELDPTSCVKLVTLLQCTLVKTGFHKRCCFAANICRQHCCASTGGVAAESVRQAFPASSAV